MAIMKIGPIAIMSGLALAGVGAAATLFMRDDDAPAKADSAAVVADEPAQTPRVAVAEAVESQNADAPVAEAPAAPAIPEFSIGSIDDLRNAGLSTLMAKIQEVEGVAYQTKIWVATADVASAPGAETFYHIKGPLTCGRIGCDLIVVSASKSILLETIGEGISSPAFDTLVINRGTGEAVTWVFDGVAFAERR